MPRSSGSSGQRRIRTQSARQSAPVPAPAKKKRATTKKARARDTEQMAVALEALADGDFSVRLSAEDGLDPRVCAAFNVLAERNQHLAHEVERVHHVVGREGQMTERAALPNAQGGWALIQDRLNALISDLVQPITEVARVISAVADGDLSQKMALSLGGHPLRGEFLRIGTTVNGMVDQLGAFSGEVTRVAREVGTEGKLGGQATVNGVSGVWKDLTDNVNLMASNLTTQVRGIVRVVTAVAGGDLSQKLVVDAKGEIAALADTLNSMTRTLGIFAEQVTSVARTVGVEGKLGAQANVPGAAGTWKDLTDNVNLLANNLTSQVRNVAEVSTAVARGDLSRKITVDVRGEMLELKNTINTMVDQLRAFASEVTRVAREVGTEGRLGGQANVLGVSGVWEDLTDNVNFMASNLTSQVRNIAKVTTAVASGDLSQKITVDVRGEMRELKETINTMVDQLRAFASEVTRVAREVGTEGKLGAQAEVPGVGGTWKDLTDNVNVLAGNLTDQVRNIAKVTTAVANGDLSQKISVEARGEIAQLKETINTMVDQLRSFAGEVTRVAREVGIEGNLGGQAHVPGARGTWRDLTDNVNQLAGSLTTQIRAISDVATAVTTGDLTRSIDVGAEGEVAALKDNVNQMIVNLKETTQKNAEQDWLKTNLARFSSMMQGQRDLEAVSRLIMSELTPLVSAHHGAFFLVHGAEVEGEEPVLKLTSTYAWRERKGVPSTFKLGEGLVGQCALEKKSILVTHAPPDYIQISSGLGEASPVNLIVLPVLFEGEVKAVLELASFQPFSTIHQIFLEQLSETIGVVLNVIVTNTRTEQLLAQSQSLTHELQKQSMELTQQQAELRRSNQELEAQALELEEKARLLEERNVLVEEKNREVEQARSSLEEKAAQLALISRYKSEFLANMSHELRTPLNSLLILARLLTENPEGNLSDKQVEYARTILASGGDLLSLINEILDLAKVESGKMQIDPRDVSMDELCGFVERTFRHVAEQKNLGFRIELEDSLPPALHTDALRLQQVLKNLLGNAFKFTHAGEVRFEARMVTPPQALTRESLRTQPGLLAFTVADTGIGIPEDKQRLIFEAFQQADGTTSRKYGGTGLGLSISREITRLLGGELVVESRPGEGSAFTLYLPLTLHETDVPLEGVERPLLAGPVSRGEPLRDDRGALDEDRRWLLVIDDDVRFARVLMAAGRRQGFQVMVATRGDEGLRLARELQPDAVCLDVRLPGVDGWTVLDALKRDPLTQHIPVQILSVVDRWRPGHHPGVFGWLQKPVPPEALLHALDRLWSLVERVERRLLVVGDNAQGADWLSEELCGGGNLTLRAVHGETEAREALAQDGWDGMVLAISEEDSPTLRLLEGLTDEERATLPPPVAWVSRPLSSREERVLRGHAASILMADAEGASERLLADVALLLHRPPEQLPPRARHALAHRDGREAQESLRVLVVDDDVRNLFALASVLERRGMEVRTAEDGKAAIEMLREGPQVDALLMDVMMPEMDGYETMRAIRAEPQWRDLPIVALTAKALREDREKCLAAGATDYLSKPVDPERLVDVIRAHVR